MISPAPYRTTAALIPVVAAAQHSKSTLHDPLPHRKELRFMSFTFSHEFTLFFTRTRVEVEVPVSITTRFCFTRPSIRPL
ncbi:unnamed protein product [Amoebophrya sp. A120]|nr:unnamed protein product [Amoebophrya sp. A120]|eukprot:GSA120T00015915001.1